MISPCAITVLLAGCGGGGGDGPAFGMPLELSASVDGAVKEDSAQGVGSALSSTPEVPRPASVAPGESDADRRADPAIAAPATHPNGNAKLWHVGRITPAGKAPTSDGRVPAHGTDRDDSHGAKATYPAGDPVGDAGPDAFVEPSLATATDSCCAQQAPIPATDNGLMPDGEAN